MIISGVTLNGTRVVDASIITQNLAIWIDANMFFYTAKLSQEQLQQNYYGLKARFGV